MPFGTLRYVYLTATLCTLLMLINVFSVFVRERQSKYSWRNRNYTNCTHYDVVNIVPLEGLLVADDRELLVLEKSENSTQNHPFLQHKMDTGKFQTITELSKMFFKLCSEKHIHTLMVKLNNKLIHTLQPYYFDYSSNNCSVLANNGYPKPFNKCTQNLTQIREKAFESRDFDILQHKLQHKANAIVSFLHIIKFGFISPSGDVLVNKFRLVPRSCPDYHHNKNYRLHAPYLRYEEVFTIAVPFGISVYHGLIEQLPRIAPFIDFLKKNKQIKIHVRGMRKQLPPPHMLEFLEILGIEKERVISGTIFARQIYMPAGQPCVNPTLFSIKLLSMQVRQALNYSPNQNSILIVKRTKSRVFVEHQIFYQSLVQFTRHTDIAVEVYSDSEGMSSIEIAKMFRRAFLVVAPHGAGEVNLLFSEPGTTVIEIICLSRKGNHILIYTILLTLLGHKFHGAVSDTNCTHVNSQFLLEPTKIFIDLFLNKKRQGNQNISTQAV